MEYFTVNEDLCSIIAGLNPDNGDSFLMICGSGDQALAISEFSLNITVVETDIEQLKYFEKILGLLRQGGMQGFYAERYQCPCLSIEELLEREVNGTNYFTLARLIKIGRNINGIKLVHGNIIDVVNGGFNKFYFSNSIGYNNEKPEEIKQNLRTIAERIAIRSLLYISNGDYIQQFVSGSGLCINHELTKSAQRYRTPFWVPIVLQK